MNKHQLIDAMVASTDLTRTAANKALDAVLNVITQALSANDSVSLVGFGTFSVRKRAARAGRNPKTGDVIQIAEALMPCFKPGKTLKEAVSEQQEEFAE